METRGLEGAGVQGHPLAAAAPDLGFVGGRDPGSQAGTTGLAVITGTEDRQHAYVALTRGTDANLAYMFTVSPKRADPLRPDSYRTRQRYRPAPPSRLAGYGVGQAEVGTRSGPPRLPLPASSATASCSWPPCPRIPPRQRQTFGLYGLRLWPPAAGAGTTPPPGNGNSRTATTPCSTPAGSARPCSPPRWPTGGSPRRVRHRTRPGIPGCHARSTPATPGAPAGSGRTSRPSGRGPGQRITRCSSSCRARAAPTFTTSRSPA